MATTVTPGRTALCGSRTTPVRLPSCYASRRATTEGRMAQKPDTPHKASGRIKLIIVLGHERLRLTLSRVLVML